MKYDAGSIKWDSFGISRINDQITDYIMVKVPTEVRHDRVQIHWF